MAHDAGKECLTWWGKPAEELRKILQERTRKEPPRGWAWRLEKEPDYDELLRLYDALLLAVKQPSDMPNAWARPPELKAKWGTIPSADIGRLARDVADGLRNDGTDVNSATKEPAHTNDGLSRYGTPNWLEKLGKIGKKPILDAKALTAARNLLRAVRDAMGR